MKRFAVLLLVGLALLGPVQAGLPEWNVRVTVQTFQLPTDRALALIPRFHRAEEARAAVQDLESDVRAGQAQCVFTGSTRTVPGQLGRIQRGQIISTGFRPGDPPLFVWGTPGQPLAIPYPFRSFETREIGYRFDVQPEFAPSGLWLEVTSESILLGGMERWEMAIERQHTLRYMELPKISSRRLETKFPLENDRPVLTGAWTCPERKDTVELQVVTAHARRVVPAPLPVSPPREFARSFYVEAQTFRVSQLDALELRPQLLNPVAMEGAYQQLLAWRRAGRAEMTALHGGFAGSFNRLRVKNLEEGPFPVGPGPIRPLSTFSTLKEVEAIPFSVQSRPTPYVPPVGFERRAVERGLGMDVYSHDEVISAVGAEFHDQWAGYRRWSVAGPRFQLGFVYFPILASRTSSHALDLAAGQRLLSSFQKIAGSDEVQITLLRASFTSPPAPVHPPSK